jgi:hypothetical protein
MDEGYRDSVTLRGDVARTAAPEAVAHAHQVRVSNACP